MALKKSEIEAFKQQLQLMRKQLTQSLRNVSEEVKSKDEAKGYSQHQADEGTDDFDQRISIEVSVEEQGLIRKIDRALEKIEEGTYGVCDISGNEIPIKRLEAIPYANMTVQAQEKLEKGIVS